MICQSTGRIQVLLAVWNLRDARELISQDYFKFSIFNYNLLCRLMKGQCNLFRVALRMPVVCYVLSRSSLEPRKLRENLIRR